MRSNTSIAPLASLAALARSLRSPTACCFSCGVVLFPVVSVKLPKSLKNRPPSFQNHPQNSRNPSENRPKSAPKSFKNEICNGLRFGSFLCLGFPRIWRRLGRFRAPLGTILGPSWGVLGRLGAVLVRPRGGLGPSLGRLGASWCILGASWERLGASWKRFGTISTKKFDFLSIFAPNFDARNLKNH